jgi:DNA-binding NarL/FixJ family response regulator
MVPVPSTILLVDPFDNDRTYYVDRLNHALPDCMILEAKDGGSAVSLSKSRRLDCLITELQLPDMSGFDFLVQMVPRASHPSVATIMLTRSSIPALSYIARINGAQAFLVKQFTTGEELVHAIEKAIAVVGPTHKACHTC